jgi:Fcf2 pre-rRNA processing
MTKNDLTDLIPGYKAPLELTTRKSTSLTATAANAPPISFKTGKMSMAARKEIKAATAGAKWFGMRRTPMTDDFKRDVQVLANRGYLDPKRFYKKTTASEELLKPGSTTILQSGTVIEGAGEYFSARLSKKQRRANLTDEIMADDRVRRYTKSQFVKIQAATRERARKRRKRR